MKATYKLDTMIKVDETLCIHCGSCVLGYPAEQYHRIPARNPIDVTWR